VIDYESADWPDHVLALTGGRGVDVLIESIGGAVFEQNFRALAPFGRCLLLGSTRGPGKPLEPRTLMTRSHGLIGFYLPVFYDTPDLVTAALRYLRTGLESSTITAHIDAVLPLAAAASAHRRIEDRDVQGVIVLIPT
jgi:NADPH2:quinone reductase